MKIRSVLALFFTVMLAVVAPSAAHARAEVSFDYFYDALAPYGEWVEVADHGTCWHPTDVDEGWAPYADGYWSYTDAGWTWVSYEEFGGIVYHYGRWVLVEDEGWCWQPDSEWGPAWVSWRSSDDYVGWAPLPPQARWRREIGISTWADHEYGIGPAFYSFCRVRDFGAPVLRPVIIGRGENVTIIRETVNITNITYNNSYGEAPLVFNGGPNYVFINQRSARPIPALKLVLNPNIQPGGQGRRGNALRAQAIGNQLVVAAPLITQPADPAFLKSKAKKSFAAEKVTTGWTGVKDPRVRDELKQEIGRQTKGLNPQTAPARPVAAAELKAVPEKANPQAAPLTTGNEQRGKPGKGEKPAPVAVAPPIGTGTPPVQPVPAGAATPEKIVREKGRGKMPPEAATAAPGAPLKPFNPTATIDHKTKPETATTSQATPNPNTVPPAVVTREKGRKPHDPNSAPPVVGAVPPVSNPVATPPEKMRESRDEADRAARAAQAEQERLAKQRAAAQQQQQQQMESQQNALRQRQQEQAAAAERQKIQGEKDRAARKQADAAAAAQQQQMEAQQQQKQRAAQEGARRQAEQQQMEAQQQQKQRAAQEGARRQAEQQRLGEQNRAVEQARRAQEAQREQSRPPAVAPQRAVQQPPPAAPAQGATPAPDPKHRKDKDKDKNGGN